MMRPSSEAGLQFLSGANADVTPASGDSRRWSLQLANRFDLQTEPGIVYTCFTFPGLTWHLATHTKAGKSTTHETLNLRAHSVLNDSVRTLPHRVHNPATPLQLVRSEEDLLDEIWNVFKKLNHLWLPTMQHLSLPSTWMTENLHQHLPRSIIFLFVCQCVFFISMTT